MICSRFYSIFLLVFFSFFCGFHSGRGGFAPSLDELKPLRFSKALKNGMQYLVLGKCLHRCGTPMDVYRKMTYFRDDKCSTSTFVYSTMTSGTSWPELGSRKHSPAPSEPLKIPDWWREWYSEVPLLRLGSPSPIGGDLLNVTWTPGPSAGHCIFQSWELQWRRWVVGYE